MRAAVLIAIKDLRRGLRDRSVIVTGFIAPLALAAIMSFAIGGSTVTFSSDMAVVDLDDSEVSRAFAQTLRSLPGLSDSIDVEEMDTPEQARRAILDDEINAAFVIPEGFAAAAASQEQQPILVLKNPGSPISGEVAESIANAFADQLASTGLVMRTASAVTGGPPPPGLAEQSSGPLPLELIDGRLGSQAVDATSYYAPAMAVFFIYFTVQMAGVGMLTERSEGTLKRLLAGPVRPWTPVAGKGLGALLMGMVSISALAVATSLLLGANWGDPLAVLALTTAMVLAALGITSLAAVSARTQESAGAIGSIIAVVFALIGGNFIPINQAPGFIQTLSLFTPNGWALRGFIDLVAEGGGVSTILPNIGALLGFAAVSMMFAVLRVRRMVSP